MDQRLLIVIAVSDGAADLLALEALPRKWDRSHCLPRLDIINLGESLRESRLNNQPCFRILATEYDETNDPRRETPCFFGGKGGVRRASRRRRIIRRTVSLVVSFLGNPAKIIAIGTLTPVVVLRTRTASSTFFRCAALFFDMLGNGVYSVETDQSKQ